MRRKKKRHKIKFIHTVGNKTHSLSLSLSRCVSISFPLQQPLRDTMHRQSLGSPSPKLPKLETLVTDEDDAPKPHRLSLSLSPLPHKFVHLIPLRLITPSHYLNKLNAPKHETRINQKEPTFINHRNQKKILFQKSQKQKAPYPHSSPCLWQWIQREMGREGKVSVTVKSKIRNNKHIFIVFQMGLKLF